MIDYWLGLSEPAILLTLTLFYAATAALIIWSVFFSPWSAAMRGLTGVVAPYFSSTAVLFALLTGFLASDVGLRNRMAWQAIVAESGAASTLEALSRASGSELAGVRNALQTYLATVINDELPLMAKEQTSDKTSEALAALLRAIAAPAVGAQAGAPVQNLLLATAARISSSRSDRLALASDQTSQFKWLTVLSLGVLTQIALALVHLERLRAHIAAQTVFSVAAIVVLTLLAIQEQPFSGVMQVSAEPMQHALQAMAKG
ncbi:MAG TPA: hypothetical protein VGC80_10040 [Acetobacteraceae bacterium]